MGKVCCFIGHRIIKESDKLILQIKEMVLRLINEGVDIFLFGSKSQFDTLCLKIVTEIKFSQYPKIIRKCYTCRNETCILESEREYWGKIYGKTLNISTTILCVDEIVDYKNKYVSGKANYVERNMSMIDDSDYCVFYYNKNYLPSRRKKSKQDLCDYQPKSGTEIAYKYAVKNKKAIYNFFVENS